MKVSLEIQPLTPTELDRSLAIKDLTDPANGVHAINLMLGRIVDAFRDDDEWPEPEVRRVSPVVSVVDNFDRLYFPPDNAGRSPVYTRYVSPTHVLRTHTSAAIPSLLSEHPDVADRFLVCPGMCYRRDVVDRTHCGEPHQIDLWRVRKGDPRLERTALLSMIDRVVQVVRPGAKYRYNEVRHPYTINGLEVEVDFDENWLEILECGEAHPEVLRDAGLDPSEYSGLAMGIGLDRLVMWIKRIDDIRLLRANDPRVHRQMTDLEPYITVSKQPLIRHDITVAVPEQAQAEDICETAREALGDDIDVLEEISIISETPVHSLPPQAIARLGLLPGQKNMLLRLVFRSMDRSLTQAEANVMRNCVYDAVHQGTVKTYANTPNR